MTWVQERWLMPGGQLAASLLWFVAAAMVTGSAVSDLVLDFVFPAIFALLFFAGLVRAIRNWNGDASLSGAALIVGTTVCGALMVVTVAITVWWHFFFSMPNF